MLEGAVASVTRQNPLVFFYVDVKDGGSKVVNWAFETMGPNGLARMGWRGDSLCPGTK